MTLNITKIETPVLGNSSETWVKQLQQRELGPVPGTTWSSNTSKEWAPNTKPEYLPSATPKGTKARPALGSGHLLKKASFACSCLLRKCSWCDLEKGIECLDIRQTAWKLELLFYLSNSPRTRKHAQTHKHTCMLALSNAHLHTYTYIHIYTHQHKQYIHVQHAQT